MPLKIPVFVSKPTVLNEKQQAVFDYIEGSLDEEMLQARTLGQSDFPQTDPITEAAFIVRSCYGGLILGFRQIECWTGVIRPGSERQLAIDKTVALGTPWNQIEGGMLIAARKPTIVFVEDGVTGGFFDPGAYSTFLQSLPVEKMDIRDWVSIRERIRLWSASVRVSFRS